MVHNSKIAPPTLNIKVKDDNSENLDKFKKYEKGSDFLITNAKEKKPDVSRASCSTPTNSATIASPKLHKNLGKVESDQVLNGVGKLTANGYSSSANSKASSEFYLNDQSLKGLGSVSEFLLNQLNQNQKFLQTNLKMNETPANSRPIPVKTQAKLSSSHQTDLRQTNPPMKAELYESPGSMLRENSSEDSEPAPVPPIRTKIKRFIPIGDAPKLVNPKAETKSVSPRHIEINKSNENNIYGNHKQVSPASSLSSSPSSSSPGSTSNNQNKSSSKSEFYYLNKNNDDSSASSNVQIEAAKPKSSAKEAARQGIFLDFDNLEYKVKNQEVQNKQPNSQFVSRDFF